MSRLVTVSYAGMSRIRFDGLADASRPRERAPQRYDLYVVLRPQKGKPFEQAPSLESLTQAEKAASISIISIQ